MMVCLDLCTGFGIVSRKTWVLLLLVVPILALTAAAALFGHLMYESEQPAGRLLYDYLYPSALYPV